MESSGQLSGQFGSNTFLDALEGVFPYVYFAKDNHGDDGKIINLSSRRSSLSSSPAEILLDLRLTKEPLFKGFIELLQRPEYNLVLTDEGVKTANYESRWYNCVKIPPKGQEETRCLIYIPEKLLKYNRVNIALISEIFTDFLASKPGSFIITFSTIDLVKRQIRDILEQKRSRELKGSFVPWTDIQDLLSVNLKEEQKKNLLASILAVY